MFPEKCDFCSSRDVRWAYPARDFDMPAFAYTSHGYWAACDDCHALIDAGDDEGLLDRSHRTFPYPPGIHIPMTSRAALRQTLRELHRKFRANRTGPPERVFRS